MPEETKKKDVMRPKASTQGHWGIDNPTGLQTSRSTKQSADVKYLSNSDARKIEVATTGSETTVSEEFYSGPALPEDLEAVDGQMGTSVVKSHGHDEKAGDYSTISKEKVIVPGPVTP